MDMFSQEVREQIPLLHTQDTLPDDQLIAYVRLTFRLAGFLLTWFLLELDNDQDTFSGYLIDPEKEQFGYFSFSYIESHFGSGLECDQFFRPKALVEAVGEERLNRHALREGLPVHETLAPHRAYYYAASYTKDATTVFKAVREIVLREEVNLSAFQISPITLPPYWTILIIGDRPAESIHEQVMHAISGGTLTTIPYDLLMRLFARKMVENQKGKWREKHTNIQLHRKPESP